MRWQCAQAHRDIGFAPFGDDPMRSAKSAFPYALPLHKQARLTSFSFGNAGDKIGTRSIFASRSRLPDRATPRVAHLLQATCHIKLYALDWCGLEAFSKGRIMLRKLFAFACLYVLLAAPASAQQASQQMPLRIGFQTGEINVLLTYAVNTGLF